MNRRQFLHTATAFSALGAVEFAPWQSMGAFARELDDFVRGPAIKDHPLRQISKHVWMIYSPDGFPTPENQGMMCNITFVDTAKGLVVVDSGASVQIGEMAIRQIRKQFNKPVIAIINSHFHGDHWLGNDAFATAYKGIPIYAHPGTIAEIQGMQGNLWRTLMEQWTNQATLGTRVVPPNTAVNHGKELKFGDVTLHMHHYGKVHTPYDICVEVVEDKLTCIGDRNYVLARRQSRGSLPSKGVPACRSQGWCDHDWQRECHEFRMGRKPGTWYGMDDRPGISRQGRVAASVPRAMCCPGVITNWKRMPFVA